MTRHQAEVIIKAKQPHSAECGRNETGMWDRSGNCARCAAWVSLNEHLIPA